MSEAIWSLLLWLVFGGLAVVALWIATVMGSATLAINEMDTGRKTFVSPGVTFLAGIILTLFTFILVGYNVIASIVSIVSIATGG